MLISTLDLFSQNFNFYLKSQQKKKGTLSGSFLSLIVFGITISYLTQNFVNDGHINLDLSEDTLSFRFDYDFNLSVDILEQQTNQTYIFYMVYCQYQQQNEFIQLPVDLVKCVNPDLQGFYCLDISKLSNRTLISNQRSNILSQIQLNIYGFNDLGYYKTTIPDNCASQDKIDNLINGVYAVLRIKVKTSQYNNRNQLYEQSYLWTKQLAGVNNCKDIRINDQRKHNLENQTLDRQSAQKLLDVEKQKKSQKILVYNNQKKIEAQIDEELDIFRIYKHILFSKKAIFMFLDQDLLAVLSVVGCTSNLLDQKQGYVLNYFEKQQAISKSDELQYEYLQKFLDKRQKKMFNLDQIDMRILESIQNGLDIY
ncbi:hypothetical protein ABPG72_010966 [Tetrahymena utriculariae]